MSNIENITEAFHSEQQEWERLHRHAREAVQYADSLGIYAVPCRHGKQIYWRPRLVNGRDPDLAWLLRSEPTHTGWPSWADAVVALAEHLKGEQSE